MKQSWTAGLSEEKALEIKQDYISSLGMRKRLIELLEAKIGTSNTFSHSKERYGDAGWPYLQADSVGYERALFEVISLINDKFV